MREGSTWAKVAFLLSVALIGANPSAAIAEETSIRATVSKILETESEDCLYFLAKGDFGSEGQQSKQFNICIFDGPDVQTNVSRVVDAYEQKSEIYILAEGSSVKRIDIIYDTLSVRNGVLTVVGESGNQKLLFDNEVLRDQEDYILSFVDKFTIDGSDVVLMMNVLGGVACPAQYFFVSVASQDKVNVSQEFGTCSDLAEPIKKGSTIVVKMPDFIENTSQRIVKYVYKDGTLYQDEKEFSSPPEEYREPTSAHTAAPITIDWFTHQQSQYQKKYVEVEIVAIVDEVEIKDIVVNRGNCKMINKKIIDIIKKTTRMQIPLKLKYGESVSVNFLNCERALQIDVITDQGSWGLNYE